MSRQHHHLKTESQYFQLVERGIKTFELRKNDRNFAVGDMVYLEESFEGKLTGRLLPPKEIKFILYGGVYGLPDDLCIINF